MKKTRLAALVLALTLLPGLAACNPAAPQATDTPSPTATPAPSAPLFTRADFPRIDGSTATAPLGRAVAARLLGESEEAVASLVQASKTTASYFNLMGYGADLLLSAAPDRTALAEQARQGFEWEMEPVADDAFVFLVNEHNQVDSLTVAELRDIYSGKITNWKEVGGADLPITAFQRNPGAGSQTLMENLVMQDTPMMAAPEDYVVETMGGLMDAVRGFDGTASAIGYSVYYYAEEMRMAGGLKLLRVEGVEPTPDTIRDETYPLLSPYYAVISAGAAEGSATRRLFDWLLSDEGQALVAECGYVSVRDTADYRPPAAERAPEEKILRWYPEETDTLLPRPEGYGTLIPFSGALSKIEYWEAGTHRRAGLMTADGRVVVDPLLFGAGALNYYDEVSGRTQYLPLLYLSRIERETDAEGDSRGAYRFALADGAGRWCTGFDYTDLYAALEGVLLADALGIYILDTAGTVTQEWAWTDLGFAPGERAEWYKEEPTPWSCGMVRLANELREDVWYQRYLNTETGQLLEFTGGSAWSRWTDDLLYYGSYDQGTARYFDKGGKTVFSFDCNESDNFRGGRAVIKPDEDTVLLIDRSGKTLLEAEGNNVSLLCQPTGDGSRWYLASEWREDKIVVIGVWDEDLNPLDIPASGTVLGQTGGGDGWVSDASGLLYRNGVCVEPPAALRRQTGYIEGAVAIYSGQGETISAYRMSDWKCLAAGGTYFYITLDHDTLTGEAYLRCYASNEADPQAAWENHRTDLMDLDGRVFCSAGYGEEVRLAGGLVELTADGSVRVTDRDGKLLYRRNDYPDRWGD